MRNVAGIDSQMNFRITLNRRDGMGGCRNAAKDQPFRELPKWSTVQELKLSSRAPHVQRRIRGVPHAHGVAVLFIVVPVANVNTMRDLRVPQLSVQVFCVITVN